MTRGEKISELRSPGMGPHPIPKDTMYARVPATAKVPANVAVELMAAAMATQLAAIPMNEPMSRGLRPMRSRNCPLMMVPNTLMAVTPTEAATASVTPAEANIDEEK